MLSYLFNTHIYIQNVHFQSHLQCMVTLLHVSFAAANRVAQRKQHQLILQHENLQTIDNISNSSNNDKIYFSRAKLYAKIKLGKKFDMGWLYIQRLVYLTNNDRRKNLLVIYVKQTKVAQRHILNVRYITPKESCLSEKTKHSIPVNLTCTQLFNTTYKTELRNLNKLSATIFKTSSN